MYFLLRFAFLLLLILLSFDVASTSRHQPAVREERDRRRRDSGDMSISRHDLTRAVITWGISFPPFLLLFLWLLLLSICPTSSNEIRLPLTSFPCVLFSVVVITLKEKKKNATLFSFQEFSSFFFALLFFCISICFECVCVRKGGAQRISAARECLTAV